jgi:epsilon-lactone hydrolase
VRVAAWLRGAVRGTIGRRTLLLGAAVATLGLLDERRTAAAGRTVGRQLAPGFWSAYSVPTTISPEWQAALRTWSGPSGETFPAADDLAGWSALQRQDERAVTRSANALIARYQPTIVEQTRGGVPVLDIRPKDWQDDGRVMVYTHGGAYTFNSARSTLSSSVPVAQAAGLRVISVDYTLAPSSQWETTTDEVARVFESLLGDGYTWDRIALYGDSAGGGLAAGSVLKMRDRGLGIPAALILWSPWADISDAGDTYATLAAADPLLRYPGQLERSAAAYADPADHRHPYVSAVYADFAPGFPPTLIQAGTKEIFLSNAVRLYRALDLAGIPAVLDMYEGMPHVFQGILPESTESQQAFARMGRFLDQFLGR